VYLNVLNHIVTFLKELHTFLPMMGAITIFEENIFIFSFAATKSVGLAAHVQRWQRK
jgi:hypothetical protein